MIEKTRRTSLVVAVVSALAAFLMPLNAHAFQLPLATRTLVQPYATGVYLFGRTTAGQYMADDCTNSAINGCIVPSPSQGVFSGFGTFTTSPVTFAEEPAVENFYFNATDTLSSIMVVGRGADNNLYYSYGGGGNTNTAPRNFTTFASLDNGQGIVFQGKPSLARVCGANASTCHSLFVFARGNKGANVNDYWFRIFSTQSSSWATPWISLGTASPDDPILVAPANTTIHNLLFVYCRGGGDHAIYERTLVLQQPTSSVPGVADTAFVASPQWEGLPDSANMPMTPNATYVQTGGQDQVWAFLRGGDNAVYYSVMNTPSNPTCPPGQNGVPTCTAPTRFTYDARGFFTGIGGQISFRQNTSGSFYSGIPGGVISSRGKPAVAWLRPQASPSYPGGVMMVGLGNDTAYYYTVFDQGTGQWLGLRGIPGGGGFETDDVLSDGNHTSIRTMGRSGTTLYYNYYNQFADIWASANAGYFNVGTGFASNPVVFLND